MKKLPLRILTLALALLLIVPAVLSSCAKKPDEALEIKVYALNGTTALGMAQMIDKSKNNTDTMNNTSLPSSPTRNSNSVADVAITSRPVW